MQASCFNWCSAEEPEICSSAGGKNGPCWADLREPPAGHLLKAFPRDVFNTGGFDLTPGLRTIVQIKRDRTIRKNHYDCIQETAQRSSVFRVHPSNSPFTGSGRIAQLAVAKLGVIHRSLNSQFKAHSSILAYF